MSLRNSLFFLLVVCSCFKIGAQSAGFIAPPPGEGPLEVTVTLHVNKIYNVNSVNETYQVDGYLVFAWQDDRLKFNPQDSLTHKLVYENQRARDIANSTFWVPAFELINIQGMQQTQNIQLIVYPDGRVMFNERFFGVFHTEMDFKRFPFDSKTFEIQIEAFSYNSKHLVFKDLKLLPGEENMDNKLGEDWELIQTSSEVATESYGNLIDRSADADEDNFSRAIFKVQAERMSGYYLWQVLFPLFIIILASFTIYWIKEFASQIGIAFTLMLTVVAFNFYSASILPKLPYNTFIEYVIIVGYIFILFGIFAVIFNHWVEDHKTKKYNLFNYFKVLVPICYVAIMAILYFSHLS